METAVLALLALGANLSGMGVLFGWQPMPDDSEKVEYIVQIEPALAATLREGQSIPITSDIPEDVGPIGRIRIVVGSEQLPRQNLATRLKPWPEQQQTQKKSREGLVEAQYKVPPVESSGSGRYGNTAAANNRILPPGGNNQAANPFAKTLQQGTQDARNLANDVKNQILPPSADQLFDSSQGASPALQNAINNTQNQFRDGMQRGIEKVADRTGQEIRQAADSFGRSANNAIDQFGKSVGGQQSILKNRQGNQNGSIMPPTTGFAGQSNSSRQAPRQMLQPPPPAPREQQATLSTSLASTPPVGTNPTSQPGDFSAPWPDTSASQPATTPVSAPPASTPSQPRYGYQRPQQPATNNTIPNQPPNQPSQQSSLNLAGRQSNAMQQPNNFGQPVFPTTNRQFDGPALTGPAQDRKSSPSQPTQAATVDLAVQRRTGPAVTTEMLNNAASNNMQTASNDQNYQERQVARHPLDNPPTDFGQTQNGQASGTNNSGSNSNLTPIVLLCILCSGSGFGNFYLFWSYLDLRSKYHGIVRGVPSRHERYDD